MSETADYVLACCNCDAGEGVESHEEAKRLGWQHLVEDPDGPGWTALGYCPECAAE